MLDKAVELIVKQILASGPRVIPVPGDPVGTHLVVDGGGGVTLRETPLPPLKHEAADLETVVAKARDWGCNEVWYNRHGVDATRGRDAVKMVLTASPQMAEICSWGPTRQWEQKQLIRTLRTVFAGCVQGVDLVSLVRKVDVSRAERVQAEQTKGRVSMSREMMAEVSGANLLPDTFTLLVPAFHQASLAGIKVRVEVALDLDAEQKAVFTLIPLAGQVEAAIGSAEDQLMESLSDLCNPEDEFLLCRGKW